MNLYLLARTVHMSCLALSIAGFVARFAAGPFARLLH
jgi:hypothetical protein